VANGDQRCQKCLKIARHSADTGPRSADRNMPGSKSMCYKPSFCSLICRRPGDQLAIPLVFLQLFTGESGK